MFFNKVSYRRGVLEGCILYTLGRLGALISPAVFPSWTYVAAPLLFLILQYMLTPFWATRRITSTKRERLSRRFLLLGPLLASLCFGIDLLISLTCGLSTGSAGTQQGPVLLRLLTNGPLHLSVANFAFVELKTAVALFAWFTLLIVCTRLAMGGFLRFTMPSGGNRVTL